MASGLTLEKDAMQTAAGRYADIECLEILRSEYGLPWTGLIFCGAAASGSMRKLEHLHGNVDYSSLRTHLGRSGVLSGKVEVMKWVKQHGAHFTFRTAQLAAELGDLPVLCYLHEQQVSFSTPDGVGAPRTIACLAAGHVEMLMWLRQHHLSEFTSDTMVAAAQRDCLEAVQYLYDQGIEVTYDVKLMATFKNHAHITHWLSDFRIEPTPTGITNLLMHLLAHLTDIDQESS